MTKKQSTAQAALIKSIVTILHLEGPATKAELMARTGVTLITLGSMSRNGHISFHADDAEILCKVTNDGRQTFGFEKDRTGLTPGKSAPSGGNYDWPESKPFSSRTGANDAFALPSHGYRC